MPRPDLLQTHAYAINRPQLSVTADDTYVGLGLSYGNGNSDPVLLLDLDLTSTRAGRLLAGAYWHRRRARASRKTRADASR